MFDTAPILQLSCRSRRMRQRPVSHLLVALNGLGARARSDDGTGCPPVTVEASGLDGGYAFVEGMNPITVPEPAKVYVSPGVRPLSWGPATKLCVNENEQVRYVAPFDGLA